MRVGIDSYSYHRRYGEVRIGERAAPEAPWALEPAPVLAHARGLGVDDLYLETCYLPAPEAITPEMLDGGPGIAVGFSWGHPWPAGAHHGLDGGRSPGAEDDLGRWIEAAARLGQPVMRITAGSPASRGTEPAADLVARLVAPLTRAADRAAAVGLALALENHGDLRAGDILELLERVDRSNLGVCLDNVNLVRVGDEYLEGIAALGPFAHLVQLKDCLAGDPTIPGGPVCTAIGEGSLDLETQLAVLAATGFDGPVCVELAALGDAALDELAMVERSISWLRSNLPPG
jgi:sugar phosphate isomerase/epimerase